MLSAHQAARRIRRKSQELLKGRPGLGIEPLKEVRARRLVQLAKDLSRPIRRHPLEQRNRFLDGKLLHQLGRSLQFRFIEHLDRTLERQMSEDAGGRLGGLLVKNIDEVGRVLRLRGAEDCRGAAPLGLDPIIVHANLQPSSDRQLW